MPLLRRSAALCVAAVLAASSAASADTSLAQAMGSQVVESAHRAIEQSMDAAREARAKANDVVGQTQPVGSKQNPISNPSLPRGFQYTLDGSLARPFGQTGYNVHFPAAVDAVVSGGGNGRVRFQAGYYELQEYPVGFDSGTVPLYLQGLGSPISAVNLANNPINTTIKNKILVLTEQNLFKVTLGGRIIPIVVSPTYVSRNGTVGGTGDVQLVESPTNGKAYTVNLRTFQQKLLAVTLPFLSTSKFFGTYTIAPEWLVKPSPVNETNHPQLFQLLYIEYRATKTTTLFFQPSKIPNYTGVDPYPQHLLTFIYGASQKLTKSSFAQIVVSDGQPTNEPANGITALTCQSIPCNANQIAPTIRGLHAAQIQFKLGIGSPAVIPL
jgi:hypothetical protein